MYKYINIDPHLCGQFFCKFLLKYFYSGTVLGEEVEYLYLEDVELPHKLYVFFCPNPVIVPYSTAVSSSHKTTECQFG